MHSVTSDRPEARRLILAAQFSCPVCRRGPAPPYELFGQRISLDEALGWRSARRRDVQSRRQRPGGILLDRDGARGGVSGSSIRRGGVGGTGAPLASPPAVSYHDRLQEEAEMNPLAQELRRLYEDGFAYDASRAQWWSRRLFMPGSWMFPETEYETRLLDRRQEDRWTARLRWDSEDEEEAAIADQEQHRRHEIRRTSIAPAALQTTVAGILSDERRSATASVSGGGGVDESHDRAAAAATSSSNDADSDRSGIAATNGGESRALHRGETVLRRHEDSSDEGDVRLIGGEQGHQRYGARETSASPGEPVHSSPGCLRRCCTECVDAVACCLLEGCLYGNWCRWCNAGPGGVMGHERRMQLRRRLRDYLDGPALRQRDGELHGLFWTVAVKFQTAIFVPSSHGIEAP